MAVLKEHHHKQVNHLEKLIETARKRNENMQSGQTQAARPIIINGKEFESLAKIIPKPVEQKLV